jgi:ribonucleases P/MRP protein subunit RPP25
LPPNEIRVKRQAGIGRYLKRAADLFNSPDNHKTVVIKGISQAIESAVKLAELVKHKIAGIHQVNKILNVTIVDEYEPLEEGLDHL